METDPCLHKLMPSKSRYRIGRDESEDTLRLRKTAERLGRESTMVHGLGPMLCERDLRCSGSLY